MSADMTTADCQREAERRFAKMVQEMNANEAKGMSSEERVQGMLDRIVAVQQHRLTSRHYKHAPDIALVARLHGLRPSRRLDALQRVLLGALDPIDSRLKGREKVYRYV